MKNLVRKILSCSVVAFSLLASFFIFSLFTLYFYEDTTYFNTDTSGCIKYYDGQSKGIVWSRGEWHHYVDFSTDITAPRQRWKITQAPLPSSLWRSNDSSIPTNRVGYRWPSDWISPFPADTWQICLLEE